MNIFLKKDTARIGINGAKKLLKYSTSRTKKEPKSKDVSRKLSEKLRFDLKTIKIILKKAKVVSIP